MDRLTPLDSLRGVAVSLVIVHHWVPGAESAGLGNIGVQLFFVLSGFLITRILLAGRTQLDEHRATFGRILRDFWVRRILRIWPVMYLTLATAFTVGAWLFVEDKSEAVWHAASLSNFLFMIKGHFEGYFSHFWSLAVEQQFYLFWPVLVLLLPRKSLPVVIACGILLAPISRLALVSLGADEFAEYNTLPTSNFDSLGIGAAIALWSTQPQQSSFAYRCLTVSAAVSIALVAMTRLGMSVPGNLEQTFFAIFSGWLVLAIYSGKLPAIARMALTFPPFVFVGTISYGLYVYHVFVPRLVSLAGPKIGLRLGPENQPEIYFSVCFIALFAVAITSWYAMERPLLLVGKNALRRSGPEQAAGTQ